MIEVLKALSHQQRQVQAQQRQVRHRVQQAHHIPHAYEHGRSCERIGEPAEPEIRKAAEQRRQNARRCERPQRERVRTALRKGIITSLGYILMLLLISGLREFLGAGALMGTQVMKNALFPMAQLPSGGFILLALVMCVWRAAAASVKQQMSLGAEHL